MPKGLTAYAVASLLWLAVAHAETGTEAQINTDNIQSSEYERLMAVARTIRAPSKEASGALDISGHPSIGSTAAPLVLVEFGSFECPYCQRHLMETFPDLKRNYVDQGKLRYVFYDFALDPEHKYAQAAAEAAHCAAEQGKYWDFRQQLYRNQKALAPLFLEAHAENVGIQKKPFEACIESARHRSRVQADLKLARSLKIRGTPTFFLGYLEDGGKKAKITRRISGFRPFDLFAEHIDALETRHARLGLN